MAAQKKEHSREKIYEAQSIDWEEYQKSKGLSDKEVEEAQEQIANEFREITLKDIEKWMEALNTKLKKFKKLKNSLEGILFG